MAAPVNSVLPAITGTATLGAALTVDEGTWSGSPTSYAYAWLRDGVAISGATTNAYTVATTDIATDIGARVTATNVDGSTAALSADQIVPTTLVVEDGTEVASANSYISRTDTDTYFLKLANTTWSALSAGAKEAALIKATAYIEQMYRLRWLGYRYTSTQVLSWPRANVPINDGPWNNFVAVDTVPQQVKDACCELALRASTEDLAADLTQGVLSETVGPLGVTYDSASTQATRYRAIDAMLAMYLGGTSMNAQLVRS